MKKTPDIKKITKAMEKTLDGKRFTHTLGVAYTAASLAMCYEVPMESAQIAGLLHDSAKCMSDSKRISVCEKHNVKVSDFEKRNAFLLHARVGSILAMDEYNVEDEDIINAIAYHTTGRPNMSILEKIIFISDYIEPNRKVAPRLDEIRHKAFENLDEALLMILEDTLKYLKSGEGEIDPMTQNTYDFYCKKSNK